MVASNSRPTEPVIEKGAFEQDSASVEHHGAANRGNGVAGDSDLVLLGYQPELQRNRGLWTVLFQSIAIIAVPFGEGTALNSALTGGGQLPYFVGWIMVSVLDQAVVMSLAEVSLFGSPRSIVPANPRGER